MSGVYPGNLYKAVLIYIKSQELKEGETQLGQKISRYMKDNNVNRVKLLDILRYNPNKLSNDSQELILRALVGTKGRIAKYFSARIAAYYLDVREEAVEEFIVFLKEKLG